MCKYLYEKKNEEMSLSLSIRLQWNDHFILYSVLFVATM